MIFVKQTILNTVAIFAAIYQIYCKTVVLSNTQNAYLHPADVSAFAQGFGATRCEIDRNTPPTNWTSP